MVTNRLQLLVFGASIVCITLILVSLSNNSKEMLQASINESSRIRDTLKAEIHTLKADVQGLYRAIQALSDKQDQKPEVDYVALWSEYADRMDESLLELAQTTQSNIKEFTSSQDKLKTKFECNQDLTPIIAEVQSYFETINDNIEIFTDTLAELNEIIISESGSSESIDSLPNKESANSQQGGYNQQGSGLNKQTQTQTQTQNKNQNQNQTPKPDPHNQAKFGGNNLPADKPKSQFDDNGAQFDDNDVQLDDNDARFDDNNNAQIDDVVLPDDDARFDDNVKPDDDFANSKPINDDDMFADDNLNGDNNIDDQQTHQPAVKEQKKLVIGVLASYARPERRIGIRETWTQYLKDTERDNDWTYKFFLGQPEEDESLLEEAKVENDKYHDIVFTDFVDTYLNLSLKTMAIARWAVDNYEFDIMMKLDDDSFIRLDWLMDLVEQAPTRKYYAGINNGPFRPDRNPKSIWYMPPEKWPSETGPAVVTGPGYLLSSDCATYLAQRSLDPDLNVLPLEDVNTAVIMNELGVEPFSLNDKFLPGMCPCRSNMILSHWCGPDDFRRYYQNSLTGRMCG